MPEVVTVAIPVRNGGALLREVLAAVRTQEIDTEIELLVADSASTDGSADLARAWGATVIDVAPGTYSHGATRNALVDRARGSHVAFLTQDAVPADAHWLARLVAGFEQADDVGLVYGPYLPRPGASVPVARELTEWFAALSPGGAVRVDRLEAAERDVPAEALLGPRAFFTDANGCLSRTAWRAVPFRDVPYAEDQRLALDMLRAGFAKVYVPQAGVVHSHEYGPVDVLRRAFDEWRGLREVYGFVEPFGVASVRRNVVGPVRADARWRRERNANGTTAASIGHHVLRYGGALLGSRADRLPQRLRARLSLEDRATFIPSDPPQST